MLLVVKRIKGGFGGELEIGGVVSTADYDGIERRVSGIVGGGKFLFSLFGLLEGPVEIRIVSLVICFLIGLDQGGELKGGIVSVVCGSERGEVEGRVGC